MLPYAYGSSDDRSTHIQSWQRSSRTRCATAYSRAEDDAVLLAHHWSDHLLEVLGLNQLGVPSFGSSEGSMSTTML